MSRFKEKKLFTLGCLLTLSKYWGKFFYRYWFSLCFSCQFDYLQKAKWGWTSNFFIHTKTGYWLWRMLQRGPCDPVIPSEITVVFVRFFLSFSLLLFIIFRVINVFWNTPRKLVLRKFIQKRYEKKWVQTASCLLTLFIYETRLRNSFHQRVSVWVKKKEEKKNYRAQILSAFYRLVGYFCNRLKKIKSPLKRSLTALTLSLLLYHYSKVISTFIQKNIFFWIKNKNNNAV